MEEIRDDENQNLTFHYNRAERLKNAPQIVKDYYSGDYKMPPKGLFKMLVYSKSSRIMLFVLVACLLLVLFIGLMRPNADEGLYENIPMKLTAFAFQDQIYTQLVMKEPKDDAEKYNENEFDVEVVFNFYDVDDVLNNSIKKTDIYKGNELAIGTTSSDYDILKVEAVIYINKEQSVLKASVTRN